MNSKDTMDTRAPLSESCSHEPGVLVEYLDYLYLEKGISKNTAYNYYMNLRTLAKFLKHTRLNMECDVSEVIMNEVSVRDMAGITKEEWDDFLSYCEFDLRERRSSMAVRISIAHGFYRWLADTKGTAIVNFVFDTKRPSSGCKSDDSSRATFVETKFDEAFQSRAFGDRNTSILKLISRYGVGLQEICDMDLEDVKVGSVIVGRSSASPREIMIDEETEKSINEYIKDRVPPKDGGNCLFVSRQRTRLHRCSVEKIIRTAAVRYGQSITVREIQRNAKTNLVKEHGLDAAFQISGVKSAAYFTGSYSG